MITTLMKHEWLRTRGLLGTITGAALLLVIAGTALTATGWPGISVIGVLMLVAALGGLVPALQIALTIHYWQSSFGRTGYFTQSLPVRGTTIFTAKLLWALLISLAGLIVVLGMLCAAWPVLAGQLGTERNPFTVISQLWSGYAEVVPVPLLVAAVGLFVGMILIWPIQYFFAASVGSEAPLNRLGLGARCSSSSACTWSCRSSSSSGWPFCPGGSGSPTGSSAWSAGGSSRSWPLGTPPPPTSCRSASSPRSSW
ncbi:hypothetical protein CFK39_04825 [Brachybacterium avium]|uniref:Uncharacterized protein n=1 Tax=Brachybacterium avium TaxID=2017485 RepID=A0A220UB52_9MICO|nr:hypothetical protein [Brachybacterium avium]ASK65265.1 hypothetical protein CFK39_04825 [Brachybacterium avium]